MLKTIVVGNEKGGTGKSTVTMHLAVALLNDGYKVATIDLDARQGTISNYFENRKKNPQQLKVPEHARIYRSDNNSIQEAQAEDYQNLLAALEDFKEFDFVIIDTPGSDVYISRLSHSLADILLTPLNESFIDLDVLVRIEDWQQKKVTPSVYSDMVWEQRKVRASMGKPGIKWIVFRNRISQLKSRNSREMDDVLSTLAPRFGFKVAAGFSERVIFRELFLQGLTVLDLTELNISSIAAREEIRNLLRTIDIKESIKSDSFLGKKGFVTIEVPDFLKKIS